jgi:hypothetical protein
MVLNGQSYAVEIEHILWKVFNCERFGFWWNGRRRLYQKVSISYNDVWIIVFIREKLMLLNRRQ